MVCEKCGRDYTGSACPQCSASDATGTFRIDPIATESNSAVEVEGLSAEEAALVVLKGAEIGEVWVLDGQTIEVGRAADSQLFLDDVTVSRHHALLRRTHNEWSVEDLGSLNGTYVNHQAISEVTELLNGTELQIGKFRFKFVVGAKA